VAGIGELTGEHIPSAQTRGLIASRSAFASEAIYDLLAAAGSDPHSERRTSMTNTIREREHNPERCRTKAPRFDRYRIVRLAV
jgi:hypothetical protein